MENPNAHGAGKCVSKVGWSEKQNEESVEIDITRLLLFKIVILIIITLIDCSHTFGLKLIEVQVVAYI